MKQPLSKNSVAVSANLLALAFGGMLVGATSGCTSQGYQADAANVVGSAEHACAGLNDCKGQGGCSTANNDCAGKNDCKGLGGCAVPPKK